jgi:hypothetical protein
LSSTTRMSSASGYWIMDGDEVAHSMSEVAARAVVRHLDIPPSTGADRNKGRDWPCRCACTRNRRAQGDPAASTTVAQDRGDIPNPVKSHGSAEECREDSVMYGTRSMAAPFRLPPSSPNLNVCAERFVRSIQERGPQQARTSRREPSTRRRPRVPCSLPRGAKPPTPGRPTHLAVRQTQPARTDRMPGTPGRAPALLSLKCGLKRPDRVFAHYGRHHHGPRRYERDARLWA